MEWQNQASENRNNEKEINGVFYGYILSSTSVSRTWSVVHISVGVRVGRVLGEPLGVRDGVPEGILDGT